VVFRALYVTILASTLSAGLYAQDAHTENDPSAALYSASAFAHGFRHGYEEGYHAADRQLQLSTFMLQDIQIHKVPKESGYKDSFGSKERFKLGFEAGFRAGFADSATSSPFRVLAWAFNTQVASHSDFDSGVEAGALTDLGCPGSKTPSYCAGIRAGRLLVGRQGDPSREVASAQRRGSGRD
jgi:hypothetical protein